MGGEEKIQKKPVTNKQDFTLCLTKKKLTRGICCIPRLANGEAMADGFPVQAAHEHIRFRSPSTHLFNLCSHSHSLQAWWASSPIESLGVGISCT
jgi:hypothetical protein